MTLPEYLSGGRIQGKTTDALPVTTVQGTDNPSLDFDFSSQPTGWNYRIVGSTSHWDNDSSRLNWETKSAGSGSGADYDLGVAQTENWVLRFKFSIDSSQSGYVDAGQGDGVLIFGLQNYPSTAAYTASTPSSQNDSTYAENHQMAQAMLILKPNQSYWKIGGRCEVTDSANFGSAQLEENISQDTNYWVEVRRVSGTSFTIKAFTNSNYSSNQVGSTGTYTVSDGLLDGLRYIHFEEHAQNVSYDSYGGGVLTDLEFWGTTATAKDKSTITNIPLGTRYEETDTRKIYRYAKDLVSGTDLKAYYKFDEASGNIENEADQVTSNDSNGSDLVVNNGGDASHIDYQGATDTPSGLPNVASWERTSATDGAFANANGASSLWNFLHYGVATSNTNIQSTICFWAKFSDVETNTMFLTTTGNGRDQPQDIGLNLKFYSDKLYSYINVGDAGGTNNESALQAYTSTSYLVQDETWHFYSMTYDWSIGSANWKVKRDNANAESFNKTSHNPVSGNAKEPLCFGHSEAATETFIPPDYAIADFSIWARVLTDAEITKIYNSGAGMDLVTGAELWKEKGTA